MTCAFVSRCAVFPLLICVALSGCSKSDPLNRQQVSGKVLLGGNPVAQGSIEFHPVDTTGTMSGAVISNGAYTIPAEQGLPPGDYIVRVFSSAGTEVPQEEFPGESDVASPELIPEEYNVNSQERRTVAAGEDNVFDFEIPGKQ